MNTCIYFTLCYATFTIAPLQALESKKNPWNLSRTPSFRLQHQQYLQTHADQWPTLEEAYPQSFGQSTPKLALLLNNQPLDFGTSNYGPIDTHEHKDTKENIHCIDTTSSLGKSFANAVKNHQGNQKLRTTINHFLQANLLAKKTITEAMAQAQKSSNTLLFDSLEAILTITSINQDRVVHYLEQKYTKDQLSSISWWQSNDANAIKDVLFYSELLGKAIAETSCRTCRKKLTKIIKSIASVQELFTLI